MIRILPTGIIDPGNHLRDVVKDLGDLGRHDVGIVIIGNGRKDGGLIDAGPHEDVVVDARSDDGLAAKVRTEAAKGIGIPVDDAHIVPFLIKDTRQPCPYTSTSQNDSNHIPCPRLSWPTPRRSTATVPERSPLSTRLPVRLPLAAGTAIRSAICCQGGAAEPDMAWCVLQDVVDSRAELVLGGTPPLGDAHEDRINAAGDRLIHDRRANLAGLEELGFDRDLRILAALLHHVEQLLALIDLRSDLGVNRQGALDLDDVRRVDRRAVASSEGRCQEQHITICRIAAHSDQELFDLHARSPWSRWSPVWRPFLRRSHLESCRSIHPPHAPSKAAAVPASLLTLRSWQSGPADRA